MCVDVVLLQIRREETGRRYSSFHENVRTERQERRRCGRILTQRSFCLPLFRVQTARILQAGKAILEVNLHRRQARAQLCEQERCRVRPFWHVSTTWKKMMTKRMHPTTDHSPSYGTDKRRLRHRNTIILSYRNRDLLVSEYVAHRCTGRVEPRRLSRTEERQAFVRLKIGRSMDKGERSQAQTV